MEKIKLNFIPLLNQDETFQIYRKIVNDSSSKNSEDEYRAQLQNDNEEWSLYDISLEGKSGYEPYVANYSLNGNLSEYYLFNLLKKSIDADWGGCKYILPTGSKYKEIKFVVASQEKGDTEIIVYPYYLKSERKIGFLFQHHFNLPSSQKFDRETQILSLSLDSSGRPNVFMYRDKESIILNFIEEQFKPFLSRNSLLIEESFCKLNSEELSRKSYIVGNGQISQSQFLGIKNSGPYRKISEKVAYLFIFSEKTRALGRDIYLGLTGKLFPGQFPGLPSMFNLPINKEIVEHKVINSFDKVSLDEFSDYIDKFVQHRQNTKIMVVAVLPRGFKGVDGVFDAYGYLKLLSLKHGVYCQVITEDSFFKKDQLKWSISNIGLQIFSKLGGSPWIVKPAKTNCLILGLGSAHEKENGVIKKYLAYTVCLDSSGDFKYIKPLSTSKNETEYLNILRTNLEEILRAELQSHYKSFVLHLPFKIKRLEIEAIKEVVNRVSVDSSCEVIVVKINTIHRFIGFGNHNTRVPYESSLVRLSPNQYLLWAEGLQYGKEVLHKRVSEPLLIDFLEAPETFESKIDCLQDILNLTGANWRGFNSKAQPISIRYSKLIADFMKEFSHFDKHLDPTILQAESVAPWFL